MTVKDLLYKICNEDFINTLVIIFDDKDKLMIIDEIGKIPFSFIKEMKYYNVLIMHCKEIGTKSIYVIKCIKEMGDEQ